MFSSVSVWLVLVHLTVEEIEAYRDEIICSRSHSESELGPRSFKLAVGVS